MMLNEEQFAEFLTSEIEKHVRAGMKSVLEKVEDRLTVALTPVELPDFQKMIDDALSGIVIPEAIKGDDGVSPSPDEVAESMKGLFSLWALDFERMANEKLEKAIDKIEKPKDGKDGKDGIDLKGFDILLGDDGRTVSLSLSDGESTFEKTLKIPSVLDKGFYNSEKVYEKGDGVSYGGGFWISQSDENTDKPASGSASWRLAVKRGRDGRESVKIDRKIETVKVKDAGNGSTGE